MSTPFARIIRRETHSPRTVTTIVLAVLIALACGYAGTELVLWMLDQPPLLVTPQQSLDWLAALPTLQPLSAISIGGILLALIGLLLMLHAIRSGRLARHEMVSEGAAVIVDNGVLASSIARRVATAARIPQVQAVVSVSHRRAIVDVTPTSGIPVDEAAIRGAVETEIASYDLRPAVRHTVRINRTGAIGS
ncbi:DNA/RNA endonuclease G [Cryobacterium arcticum]|uniref:DNA/RNA endonuclease G n=1 Tax=Cryobacterium arcticum TaxID=670052 RepID=A0A317ZWM7_9MICO|nr:DNA/RNA endonuclease G [Cryobacterium arcticum]PXA71684.1 DNA/RNA endonuclease G [Cryobacterium arcticum]